MAFLLSTPISSEPVTPSTTIRWHLPLIEQLRNEVEPKLWIGESAVDWANRFDASFAKQCAESSHSELKVALDRWQLKAFTVQRTIDARFRAAAVLAFGGANVRRPVNNKKLWASIDNWLGLLDEIPFLSRAEAYRRFRELRRAGRIPGMGPSFFTKLIYFFGRGDGYILNQWLAKALHFLNDANWVRDATGKLAFKLGGKGFPRLIHSGQGIHDSNTEQDYEVYCNAIESLTPLLGRVDGPDTERWLFSFPGSSWRRLLAAQTESKLR